MTYIPGTTIAKPTIGDRTVELLFEGQLSHDQIVAKILEEYPEAETTKKCVQWYAWTLRKQGLLAAAPKLTAEQKLARKKQKDAEWRQNRAAKWADMKAAVEARQVEQTEAETEE
jgi:hypothetical protein